MPVIRAVTKSAINNYGMKSLASWMVSKDGGKKLYSLTLKQYQVLPILEERFWVAVIVTILFVI